MAMPEPIGARSGLETPRRTTTGTELATTELNSDGQEDERPKAEDTTEESTARRDEKRSTYGRFIQVGDVILFGAIGLQFERIAGDPFAWQESGANEPTRSS